MYRRLVGYQVRQGLWAATPKKRLLAGG